MPVSVFFACFISKGAGQMSGGGVIEREEENRTGTSNSSVDDELSVPCTVDVPGEMKRRNHNSER